MRTPRIKIKWQGIQLVSCIAEKKPQTFDHKLENKQASKKTGIVFGQSHGLLLSVNMDEAYDFENSFTFPA